ncbi:hypothetical protein [Bacillus sp. mrc49]|uniref:hypothetical protein n=1 Tax=Bacillus sp. mrc49 TaxID=2054913 RepID=UPI000C26E95B|nr:hypothetical protein [Bacillus sp. mrc49]PJN91013.1 hypothetical protein CVN76_07435 [Bacillus sp. mrc49]
MDIKTLEYLEERSLKGRELLDQIENLKKQVSMVKKSRGIIDIHTPVSSIRPIRNAQDGQLSNNYQTQVIAHMYNTFINVTHSEIQCLEQELAEL